MTKQDITKLIYCYFYFKYPTTTRWFLEWQREVYLYLISLEYSTQRESGDGKCSYDDCDHPQGAVIALTEYCGKTNSHGAVMKAASNYLSVRSVVVTVVSGGVQQLQFGIVRQQRPLNNTTFSVAQTETLWSYKWMDETPPNCSTFKTWQEMSLSFYRKGSFASIKNNCVIENYVSF